MHRIDTSTREIDKFGAGKDGFTNGDPGITAPTEADDDWLNSVQEEFCNVVEDTGITLVKGTRDQLLTSLQNMQKLWALNNWREIPLASPKAVDLNAVTGGDTLAHGGFVAVGDADGVDGYMLHGDVTGVFSHGAWDYNGEETNPKNVRLNAVAHGNGSFVAVGEREAAADTYIIYGVYESGFSEAATSPSDIRPANSVVWTGSYWVVVGDYTASNGPLIARSTTPGGPYVVVASGLSDVSAIGVTYNGTVVCAVGNNVGSYPLIGISSNDGGSWSEVDSGHGVVNLACVAANTATGTIIACGQSQALRSTDDGATWDDITPALTGGALSIIFGDGVFTALRDSILYVSFDDGLTWRPCHIPYSSGGVSSVGYCGALRCFYLVGGDDGTRPLLYRSGSITW
jgi:hypothetical protein